MVRALSKYEDGWIAPVVSFQGGRITSDKCVWCGSTCKLSKSHLIPEVLGGKMAFRIACAKCNNELGQKYEGAAKNNAYLAAAIANLGIASSREAFRHAKIFDDETGFQMKIDEEYVTPIAKELSEGKFIGSKEDRKRYHVFRFKKTHPGVDTTPLEEFFDKGESGRISFHGCTFSMEEFPSKETKIRIEDLTRDIDAELIFKIIYEFLALNGFLNHPVIGPRVRKYVALEGVGKSANIQIRPEIAGVILGNISNTFSRYERLEEIPFRDYHYFILRMTSKAILYCELVLFGQLRHFFIMGKWRPRDDEIFFALGRAWVFPISGDFEGPIVYENIQKKDHVTWADEAVDVRVWELERK